jgi:hypothetical protein
VKGPREQDTVNAILRYLGAMHIYAWRVNVGAVTARAHDFNASDRFIRFGTKGTSDILGLIPPTGRMLAVEVKLPGREATVYQTAFLEQVRKHGGLAFVAHSVKEVERALHEMP